MMIDPKKPLETEPDERNPVPVRMMTGQEVFCLASNCEFEPMAIIRALGIIRPDPDPAQVIAAKLGADVDLVRAVIEEMGK